MTKKPFGSIVMGKEGATVRALREHARAIGWRLQLHPRKLDQCRLIDSNGTAQTHWGTLADIQTYLDLQGDDR